MEFKQSEVDSQLSLPKESPSRTLRASEEDVAAYLKMEDVALADAATLRQKVGGDLAHLCVCHGCAMAQHDNIACFSNARLDCSLVD